MTVWTAVLLIALATIVASTVALFVLAERAPDEHDLWPHDDTEH